MPNLLMRPIFALTLAALVLPAAGWAEGEATPAVTEATTPAPEFVGDAGAYLAARIAATESDYRAAASWFTRALVADPSNIGLMEGALVSDLTLGQFDTATVLAKRLQEGGVENQTALLALLTDQAKRNDYAAILADAKAGKSINPLLDGLVVAWAELGNGRMTEATAAFDKVATTKGMEVFGLYHKALALASVGDFEGADAIFSGPAQTKIQSLRRGVIAHAQVLSQLERNPEAIAVLDKVFGLGQDPAIDALRARLAAGETVPYDIAMTANEGLAEVFFTLATALNGQADNGYTLVYTRIASHLRPGHTEALLLSAGLLDAQGQFDLAVETYASVPADDPSFHIAEIGRADSLYAAGKTEASIEVLQALTRSHGKIVPVNVALGDALRREEKYDDAAKAYDVAVGLIGTPTAQDWPLFYSRGICHERQKRWPAAEADFRKALELSPDQPVVLNYLGYSYLEMNQNLDEALDMIKRAMAAQPDNGYITDSYAWGLYRLGRIKEAVEPMEKASLLEPVDATVTDHLGDIYWAVGRKLEAQFQWRRALSFDPAEKDATRMRRKLEVGLDAVLAEEGAKPLPAVTADGN